MTVQTPAHVHARGRTRDRHLPNISVASLATHTRQQMRLVAEEDMIRHFGDPLPRYGLLTLPVAEQGLHFSSIRGDHAMASDTTLNGRNSGHIGAHGIGMAEQALNPRLAVEVVAKCYGLAGGSQGSALC